MTVNGTKKLGGETKLWVIQLKYKASKEWKSGDCIEEYLKAKGAAIKQQYILQKRRSGRAVCQHQQ